MGWVKVGNDVEPDGKPFESPRDTFEQAYNDRLDKGESVEDLDGLPLSTRTMERKPENEAATRNLLDWFFDAYTQSQAISAGNTHEELDQLAKEGLTWAGYHGIPITDAERNVAERLGVNVKHLGSKPVTPSTSHRLGF